jgi:hypothetical protein
MALLILKTDEINKDTKTKVSSEVYLPHSVAFIIALLRNGTLEHMAATTWAKDKMISDQLGGYSKYGHSSVCLDQNIKGMYDKFVRCNVSCIRLTKTYGRWSCFKGWKMVFWND